MEKIRILDTSAIWLEHARLINDAYKEFSGNHTTCYELKEELFHFHATDKTLRSNHKQTNTYEYLLENTAGSENPKINSERKRKRKNKLSLIPTNQSGLETKITVFLQQIKEIRNFGNDSPETTTIIPRYWEEQHTFPKFKGANCTDQFQSFSFGEQTYLIPARSIFYSHDVTQLNEILGEMQPYDLIVMDPPWRNKYIRRLKKLKLELGYYMLDNMELQKMPIAQLIKRHSLVAIWCTNAEQHQRAIMEKFLPEWNLCLVQTLKWLKISTSGALIGSINEIGMKQPYEMLYIACHKEAEQEFSGLKSIDFIASIPSVVHSHKPPLLRWLQQYLPAHARCLELFARYLQPHFTSVGLEVLKLMDERLYIKKESK